MGMPTYGRERRSACTATGCGRRGRVRREPRSREPFPDASCCLDLAELFKTERVGPEVIFLQRGDNPLRQRPGSRVGRQPLAAEPPPGAIWSPGSAWGCRPTGAAQGRHGDTDLRERERRAAILCRRSVRIANRPLNSG